jgi:hypothetical protein
LHTTGARPLHQLPKPDVAAHPDSRVDAGSSANLPQNNTRQSSPNTRAAVYPAGARGDDLHSFTAKSESRLELLCHA